MSHLKLIAIVACLTLWSAGSALANPWGYHHGYHGYRGPIYGYPPVVVAPPPFYAPPPVVVAPPPMPAYYPPPAYIAPAPVAPVYAPSYTYGAVGPRGFGFGYSSPGFGVYLGR